jgi:hypothetical protein
VAVSNGCNGNAAEETDRKMTKPTIDEQIADFISIWDKNPLTDDAKNAILESLKRLKSAEQAEAENTRLLAGLREPTPEMIEAGVSYLFNIILLTRWTDDPELSRDLFKAMADKLIKKSETEVKVFPKVLPGQGWLLISPEHPDGVMHRFDGEKWIPEDQENKSTKEK